MRTITAAALMSLPVTAFDLASDAALAAGWPGPEAFLAVSMMVAAGMSADVVERVFRDAARRLQ